jgi:hypothetical protein
MVFVVSTVGCSPRRQASSQAILFCASCMDDLVANGQTMPSVMRGRVNNALTRVIGPSNDVIQPKTIEDDGLSG